MPDGPDERPVSGGDDHPTDAELRGHLDERLDPETDRQVADHLDTCAACVARLDTFASAPVLNLDRASPEASGAWDERRMRRSIRRTLLRTAVNTLALLVVGAIALQFVGQLVLQPVLVDRGNRMQHSVIATHDLPVLTIPGAEVAQVVSNPDIIRRTTEVEVQRAVGAEMAPLGWLTTRLGPFDMSASHGAFVSPTYVSLHTRDGTSFGDGNQSQVPFEPERLGEGTAATVELVWTDGIAQADAQAVADDAAGAALLWVGFLVAGADARYWPEARLGYSACGAPRSFLLEATERGTGGFGGSGFRERGLEGSGVQHALEQVRRATDNLAETGWLDDEEPSAPLADAGATAAALADTEPAVTTLVLTGPTDVISTAVEDAAPDSANLLDVDFDRGAPAACG